jgi:hypothetical protein
VGWGEEGALAQCVGLELVGMLTEERIQSLIKALVPRKHKEDENLLGIARLLCKVTYPGWSLSESGGGYLCFCVEELIEGLRKRIVSAGLIPVLLSYGQQGLISFYRTIEREELLFGPIIAKGSGGVVYQGQWKQKYAQNALYL